MKKILLSCFISTLLFSEGFLSEDLNEIKTKFPTANTLEQVEYVKFLVQKNDKTSSKIMLDNYLTSSSRVQNSITAGAKKMGVDFLSEIKNLMSENLNNKDNFDSLMKFLHSVNKQEHDKIQILSDSELKKYFNK